MLLDPTGIEPTTSWSLVTHTSNWAISPYCWMCGNQSWSDASFWYVFSVSSLQCLLRPICPNNCTNKRLCLCCSSSLCVSTCTDQRRFLCCTMQYFFNHVTNFTWLVLSLLLLAPLEDCALWLRHFLGIVNVLNFPTPKCLTKWHMQTVQTQIRLLLKEQFDQGLLCLPFHKVVYATGA